MRIINFSASFIWYLDVLEHSANMVQLSFAFQEFDSLIRWQIHHINDGKIHERAQISIVALAGAHRSAT